LLSEVDLGTWEASGSGSYLDIAGIDAQTGLFSEFLAVLGQASIVNLEVTNNLVINDSLYIGNNSLGVIGGNNTLYLQPSGLGVIDIMAGKVTINNAGNVYIEVAVFKRWIVMKTQKLVWVILLTLLFITPAIKGAGWDQMWQIRREVSLTPGPVIVRGNNYQTPHKIFWKEARGALAI